MLSSISQVDIFSNYINDNYHGWEITNNGKYLFNNALDTEPTLIYNTETNTISELSYKKGDKYQKILFTSNHIIYNSIDNIIIGEYNNNDIIKIINNFTIIDLIKNDKYLFVKEIGDIVKVYNLNNFEAVFSVYNLYTKCMNVSPDNKYLVIGGIKITLYTLDEPRLILSYKTNSMVLIIAICDRYIATINKDGMIIIYSIYGVQLFTIYECDLDKTYQTLIYSHDENYLYYGDNTELIIYETERYNIIKKYNLENVTSYHLTDDDYKLLYVNDKEIGCIYLPKFCNIIHDILIEYLPEELIMIILTMISPVS